MRAIRHGYTAGGDGRKAALSGGDGRKAAIAVPPVLGSSGMGSPSLAVAAYPTRGGGPAERRATLGDGPRAAPRPSLGYSTAALATRGSVSYAIPVPPHELEAVIRYQKEAVLNVLTEVINDFKQLQCIPACAQGELEDPDDAPKELLALQAFEARVLGNPMPNWQRTYCTLMKAAVKAKVTCPPSPSLAAFTEMLGRLKYIVETKLYTTTQEDEKMQQVLQEKLTKEQTTNADVKAITQQMQHERENLEATIQKLDVEIFKYDGEARAITTSSRVEMEEIERGFAEAALLAEESCRKQEEEMNARILELEQSILASQKQNQARESVLRQEKRKKITFLETIINQYDEDLESKNGVINKLQSKQSRDQKRVEELQKQLEVVDTASAQRRSEERYTKERKEHLNFIHLSMEASCRLVQAHWRGFYVRSLINTKRKKLPKGFFHPHKGSVTTTLGQITRPVISGAASTSSRMTHETASVQGDGRYSPSAMSHASMRQSVVSTADEYSDPRAKMIRTDSISSNMGNKKRSESRVDMLLSVMDRSIDRKKSEVQGHETLSAFDRKKSDARTLTSSSSSNDGRREALPVAAHAPGSVLDMRKKSELRGPPSEGHSTVERSTPTHSEGASSMGQVLERKKSAGSLAKQKSLGELRSHCAALQTLPLRLGGAPKDEADCCAKIGKCLHIMKPTPKTTVTVSVHARTSKANALIKGEGIVTHLMRESGLKRHQFDVGVTVNETIPECIQITTDVPMA